MLESGEMYLETILILSEQSDKVRAINIADAMGFSKASVSVGLSKLKSYNFVEVDKDGFITLTPAGLAIAESTYEKHKVLTEALVRLGVDESTASADACKIEHDISDESFAAIKSYLKMK